MGKTEEKQNNKKLRSRRIQNSVSSCQIVCPPPEIRTGATQLRIRTRAWWVNGEVGSGKRKSKSQKTVKFRVEKSEKN